METVLSDVGAAAATAARAVGGQRSRRAGTGVGVDTRAQGRPITFNGEDGKRSDWNVAFRSYARLVNTSLATLVPYADATDPVAPANTLQVDETILPASLDFYHLLLHQVVTGGEMGPEAEKQVNGILLGLKRFDYERAVVTVQNVSSETVSSAMKVGLVLNRLGDSELGSQLVMNAERPG